MNTRTITGSGLAVAAALLLAGHNSTRAKETPTQHGVVILRAYERYVTVRENLPESRGDKYGYVGYAVLNASASSNAPQVELPWFYYTGPEGTNSPTPPAPVPYAQALADLLDQGYRVDFTSADGLTVRLVR